MKCCCTNSSCTTVLYIAETGLLYASKKPCLVSATVGGENAAQLPPIFELDKLRRTSEMHQQHQLKLRTSPPARPTCGHDLCSDGIRPAYTVQ